MYCCVVQHDKDWVTFDVGAIDGKINKIFSQWLGDGGGALRFGHDAVWLTDYKHGTFSRITYVEIMKAKTSQ